MSTLDREKAARAVGIDPEELLDICTRSGATYPQTLATRILALVQPDPRVGTALALHHVKDFTRPSGRIVQLCKVCNVTYPCATRRALEGGAA